MLERCPAVEAVQGFRTAEIRLLLHGADKRPVLLGLDQNISPVRKNLRAANSKDSPDSSQ